MKRSKKLWILAAVLLAACLLMLFIVSREEKKEEIKTSGEVVLNIPAETVKAVKWKQPIDGTDMSFRKDEGWIYEGDENFPVDGEKLEELLLSEFEDFSAAFIIENVEDFTQYGLEEPVCTIHIDTDSQAYEIKLGNYSSMDSQRYVSIGDGNVYLAVNDPLDAYNIQLNRLIKNDTVPDFGDFKAMSIDGEESYEIVRDEEAGISYRSGDKYYTSLNGESLPLDNHLVEEYADKIAFLNINNYVSYNTADDKLSEYGMDDPELKVTMDYTEKDEEGNETPASFTLSVSRKPEEIEKQRKSEDGYSVDTLILEDPENITAYARVNESDIIYSITGEDYQRLMVCRYNDLRDQRIIPVDFDDIVQIDAELDGSSYSFIRSEKGEEEKFSYLDNPVDITDIKDIMNSMISRKFTSEKPELKEEIKLTVYLEDERKAEISICRYDGTDCLAVLNGEPLSLTGRDKVVELIESINAIVLSQSEEDLPEKA